MFQIDYDGEEYLICEISEDELEHFPDDALGFFEQLPQAYYVRRDNALKCDKISTISNSAVMQVIDDDVHLLKILIRGKV